MTLNTGYVLPGVCIPVITVDCSALVQVCTLLSVHLVHLLFLRLAYRSNSAQILTCNGSQKVKSYKGFPFGGLNEL